MLFSFPDQLSLAKKEGELNSPSHCRQHYLLFFRSNQPEQVDHPVGESGFIVIPGNNLDHRITNYLGTGSIDNRGKRITVVIDGDQRLLTETKDTFERTLGGFLEGCIDLKDIGLFIERD